MKIMSAAYQFARKMRINLEKERSVKSNEMLTFNISLKLILICPHNLLILTNSQFKLLPIQSGRNSSSFCPMTLISVLMTFVLK